MSWYFEFVRNYLWTLLLLFISAFWLKKKSKYIQSSFFCPALRAMVVKHKWLQYWCCWKLLTQFWSGVQRPHRVISLMSHRKTCCLAYHLFLAQWLVTWLLALMGQHALHWEISLWQQKLPFQNMIHTEDSLERNVSCVASQFFQEFLASISWIIFWNKRFGLTSGFILQLRLHRILFVQSESF